jgi:hypothetical protein
MKKDAAAKKIADQKAAKDKADILKKQKESNKPNGKINNTVKPNISN